MIETLLKSGMKVTEIARHLKCSADSIYYEIRRTGATRETYNADKAQESAKKQAWYTEEDLDAIETLRCHGWTYRQVDRFLGPPGKLQRILKHFHTTYFDFSAEAAKRIQRKEVMESEGAEIRGLTYYELKKERKPAPLTAREKYERAVGHKLRHP